MTTPLDPNWPNASQWLQGDRNSGVLGSLGVIGVPSSSASITPGRCDLAPAAVRRVLSRLSTYDVSTDKDLRNLEVKDFGDMSVSRLSPQDAYHQIASATRQLVDQVDVLVAFGGDNSITRPLLVGVTEEISTCGLLTIDAHFDLRDLDGGLTNGNPVRALLADGLPGEQIVQVGIQSFSNSRAYARIAIEAGIKVLTIERLRQIGIEQAIEDALAHLSQVARTIYVDLDLDVLDRAFVPGTPGSRPGGLTPLEVFRVAELCGRHPNVKALDLVEVDPSKDVADTTVFCMAKAFLSFASGLCTRFAQR